MQRDERSEKRLSEAIESLAAAFGVEATTALVRGYVMALQDLGVDVIEHGVQLALTQFETMPKPVELRRLVGVVSPQDVASNAWEDLYAAIGRHGQYVSVDFEDGLVNATVRGLGGWQYLCSLRSKDLRGRVRHEFVRTYVALSKSGVSQEQKQYLAGRSSGAQAPVSIKARCLPGSTRPVQLRLLISDHESGHIARGGQPKANKCTPWQRSLRGASWGHETGGTDDSDSPGTADW